MKVSNFKPIRAGNNKLYSIGVDSLVDRYIITIDEKITYYRDGTPAYFSYYSEAKKTLFEMSGSCLTVVPN